jgi:hypothetical protein
MNRDYRKDKAPPRMQVDLTLEILREVLSYDAETGQFRHIGTRHNPRRSLDRAGSANHKGHRRIILFGRPMAEHVLAWFYVYGVWPDRIVDHINGDPSDNRIGNLRLATHSQNSANAGVRADNKSGVKGVWWCRSTQRWKAAVRVNGKRKSLGAYHNMEQAIAAYRAEATRAFGEYARFE